MTPNKVLAMFNLRNTVSFDIPPLDYREQKSLWETHIGTAANELNGEMTQPIAQFNLNSTTIQAACNSFANPEDSLSTQLLNYCRTQSRPRLDELAQPIDPSATWSDLILPEPQAQVLQDIAIATSRHSLSRLGICRPRESRLGNCRTVIPATSGNPSSVKLQDLRTDR